MTTCTLFEEMMSLKMDGRLPEGQKRALEAHLRSCSCCASLWKRMEQLQESLRNIPQAPLPEGFDERFFLRLQHLRAKSHKAAPLEMPFWKRRLLVPIPVAFAFILLLFGSLVFGLVFQKGKIPPSKQRVEWKVPEWEKFRKVRKIKITKKDVIKRYNTSLNSI